MAIVDHMAVLAVPGRPTAPERHQMGAADEQIEPVVV